MTTPYSTFTYYTNTFLGTQIASADFDALALRASAIIDQQTFQRAIVVWDAGTDADTIDLISMACCNLAETIQTLDADSGADGITSEKVGSHSVNYGAQSSKQMTTEQKYAQSLRVYLDGTELMFSGFASGEYGGTLS